MVQHSDRVVVGIAAFRSRRLAVIQLISAALLACDGRWGASSAESQADRSAPPAGESSAATAPHQSTGVLAGFALGARDGVRNELPGRLAEVSGLAVAPDGRVFTHADERGVVSEIDPRSGRVVKSFSLGDRVRGDFEGLAIVGTRFFMTTSDGTLVEFAEGADGGSVEYTEHETGVGRQCEVEGLEYDGATNALLLACKTPRNRDLRGRFTVFAWSLERRAAEPAPRFSIPHDFLRQHGQKNDLHVSGIAIHGPSGALVAVAAQEKLLVEVTRQGRVVDVKELAGRHPQAEGIAFLPGGELLIADERADGGVITLYSPRTASPTKEPQP